MRNVLDKKAGASSDTHKTAKEGLSPSDLKEETLRGVLDEIFTLSSGAVTTPEEPPHASNVKDKPERRVVDKSAKPSFSGAGKTAKGRLNASNVKAKTSKNVREKRAGPSSGTGPTAAKPPGASNVREKTLRTVLDEIAQPSSGADTPAEEPRISLDVKDESLRRVLDRIGNHSGYRILFDDEWENFPITLKLNNETLEDALSRVMGSLNHAVVWNEVEKKISVIIYGQAKTGLSRRSAGGAFSRQDVRDSRIPSTRGRVETRSPVYRTVPRRQRSPASTPGISPSRPTPARSAEAPDTEVSLSGEETDFDQATSTIVE
ncbi:MAG: hypothetical protein JSW39_20475 [Desulfobacterales bacterium]|nr:MAG: hypothetical protein JSW39_20475 [Desulfobacterales bacterium]